MDLQNRRDPEVTFIIGAPRSGTTWLAKVFDSHPDIVFRNEPDISLREDRLPVLCRAADIERHRELARDYLRSLIGITTLKASGTLPVFPKSYRRAVPAALRQAMIYGLHAVDSLGGKGCWSSRVPIPDCVRRVRIPPAVVIKSVSARGRARLFAEALPSSRLIFILRHPCAQVESTLRGMRLGKLAHPTWLAEVLAADQARRLGLTAETFAALTLVEKLAWHWAVMNQKVLDDLTGLPRVMVVRYEDVVARATTLLKQLFEFAGLSWHEQTDAFVERSTNYDGPQGYFSVWRNAGEATARWRQSLPREDQGRILDISRRVAAGQLYR